MVPGSIRQTQRYVSPPDRLAYYQLVWEIVRQIPRGKVCTYGKIAEMIGPPTGMDPRAYQAFSPRWVGGAMAACPDNVPWQRVINSQGKISLRPGDNAFVQMELLIEEGVVFNESGRVNLDMFLWDGKPVPDQE